MAAPAARQAVTKAAGRASSVWIGSSKPLSLAEKLDQHRASELESVDLAQAATEAAATQAPARQDTLKSFAFHIGADLPVPTVDKRDTHTVDPVVQHEASEAADPFSGLPLKAWAERLGERVMPTYELIQEEQRKAKQAAKSLPPPEVAMPAVPHLLPFTRWASKSREFRDTFIAEDAKTRKKARLSWYHPDDTMVPRDWFRGGLLEDLKYYAPFRRPKPSVQ